MSNNLKNNSRKPLLLCILDGWGFREDNLSDNAIALAKTPNYDKILKEFPASLLGTSGLDVGLPDGQMGNSEVGHICIGSGRVILQDLPRINKSIENGELEKNSYLQNLINSCQENNNICHLLGLLSDGGVHSHQNHIIVLARILAKNKINVKIHCFLDGRDVGQKTAKTYLQNLIDQIQNYPQIKIATISGRYYAMDRDKNWDRIALSYDAIAKAKVVKFSNPIKAIDDFYQKDISDEFILPIIADDYDGIKEGDGLLVANFRADRIRQICESLILREGKIDFAAKVSMTSYSDDLDPHFNILFPQIEIKNSLGEILENNNLMQLRIAETEKYAHVTFFFSGGRETKFKGEDRILVKSPSVATYDLLPEMSCESVGKKLKDAIKSNKYDFIVVNYANPDMVGHSGVLEAAIKACETIDKQIAMLKDIILEQNGSMIITADHGNIENMIDDKGNPHTMHTTNPVPFILISNDLKNIRLHNGKLCDITPTILELMNLDKPEEITGKSLINKITKFYV